MQTKGHGRFLKTVFLKAGILLNMAARLITLIGSLFLLWLLWRLFARPEDSFFKLREADRLKGKKKFSEKEKGDLGQAKFDVKKTPLLTGIRTDGPPHETLGVRETASVEEIQKAFKNQMKNYHPDKVGPPDSREWHDAQAIAVALNSAKEFMLSKLKKK